ncbi:MAG: PIG-L family deacetylase [Flavobacteriaceae bacterium]|nr:PIG-L family deacetylase [Flavobacteriaceae bacterium]
MQKQLLFVLYTFFFFSFSQAQNPQKLNSSEIFEAVQKLNFLGSVLYVAAHPDDENTRLISYMSNQVKARTAYLSLTRGDGGQNLIGPELRELLGVIRTQELLAARRIDGGEQFFSRANDFGYSKHPDETLEIWNKDQVLSDVVWAIRKFKPDVIINRFDHRTPGRTHGHHTSSAMLSLEAFDLSNNITQYPEQLSFVEPWQPKRIFFNTSWWFYGSQEKFKNADKSNMLNFDIGVYYPLKGLSNNEVASLASSQHLCQGFGRLSQRGSQQEYVELLKGDMPSENNIFSGIDTTWNRVKGGQEIGTILKSVEQNFNFKNPESHLSDLIEAYKLIQELEDNYWKTQKTKELKLIIEACAGLYMEGSANVANITTGDNVTVNIEIVKRSNTTIKLKSVSLTPLNKSENPSIILENNKRYNFKISGEIPNKTPFTSPYWLNETGTLGMYTVNNSQNIGKPETDRALQVNFILDFNGYTIGFSKDVVYRYSKPDKGELYKPFDVLPEITLKMSDDVYFFNTDKQKEIEVTVKAGKDNIEGFVSMCYPNDWNIYPEKQKLILKNKGEEKTFVFTVIPPKSNSEGLISPMVDVNGKNFSKELIEIDYNHIPFQNVLLHSESKVVRLDINKIGNNIAYIVGAGDSVPENLQQIGYNVVTINPEDISSEALSNFDAVVVGIRAYNVLDELKQKQQILFDFIEQGGNMIVQYNTSRRLKVDNLAPYHLKLSRDRVTDEHAEVRLLNPNHELLNYPNKISPQDFEGWTQERGLYFPGEWDEAFTPILSLNDKNETPKNGSLLVAKYGKGYYMYTGLSFFRQFPEGVTGAYRLFANMLSIGKENITNKPKLTD